MTWPWAWACPQPPVRSSWTPTETRPASGSASRALPDRPKGRPGRRHLSPVQGDSADAEGELRPPRELRAGSGPRVRDGRALRGRRGRLEFVPSIRYIRLDRQEDSHEKDRERMSAGGERHRRPLHVCLQVRPVRGTESVHPGYGRRDQMGFQVLPAVASPAHPGSRRVLPRQERRHHAPRSTSTSTPSSSSRAIPRTWETISWPPSGARP